MVGDSVTQANMQAARSALRNQLAMQRMTGATQADQIATMKRIQTIDQQINQSKIHRASLEETRISAQKLSSAMSGAAATMTAVGTGMVAAGVLGVAGIKSLVDSAIDYQKQASLTRTQVDKFAASLKDIEDIGLRVANKIGVPFAQIQPALFDIFSSLEIGTKDAERLLEIFAKAAVAGQTDIQSASRATIGILNAFQLPLTSVNHLMDLQFQLVQEGVGTYEEWTQRIGLVSPSAVRAGQSVETMLAALAATTRQGISAARSGTAVARAFDAMSNPNAVEAMKAMGVNALDASGKFRPIIDVLGEFRTQITKLPQSERIAKILEVFKGAGGTIEARRFLQNMLLTPGNLEQFKSIFEEMSNESGSFEKAYSIMAESAATKSELLSNKWETLKVKAGEALIPTFLKVVGALGSLFDWFNKLDPSTQSMIATSTALFLALTGVGGILLILVGTLAAFIAAVVVAGSSLFVVLGILSAVGIAVVAFGVGLAIAWKNSANFRGIIQDLGKKMEDFYKNYIVPTGLAIKEAWEKNMQPALSALADIIEHKILPVVRDFNNFLASELFKSAMEVGNNIKDFLVFAFEKLGSIINTMIIPVIQKLTQYYHDHEETIKQVATWMIFLGKWIAKIALIFGAILAVVLIGPVVAAFVAVIAVIGAVIGIIVFLVEAVKAIIHWFGTEVPKAWGALVDAAKATWNAIASFFVELWNNIASFFVGVWNNIVGIFNTVMGVLAAAWNTFWNSSIGGLIKAVLGAIWAFIKLIFVSIQFTILVVLKAIEDAWNFTWNAMKNGAMIIWNFIFPFLKDTWEKISGGAKLIWQSISDFWNFIWTGVKNAATVIWNATVGFIIGKWNEIKAAASAIWNAVHAGIVGPVDKSNDKIVSVWNSIKEFFSNTGSWLFNAGKNLIQGLIDGITSMVNKVTDKINEITQKIKDHFPHSPAKIGPLSGKGGMYFAGQNITKQLYQGMQSNMSLVANASSLIASAVGPTTPGVNGSTATGRTYNQQITINTQEINPRRQAAELGWLLQGRA
jgi:TP901 family phage tail tape measure protein